MDNDGVVTYSLEKEDSSGLYRKECEKGTTTCNGDSIVQLTYPLSVGKTWTTQGFQGPVTVSITATNLTVTTEAGTFHNVIEVKTKNFEEYFYFAPNAGMIKGKALGDTVLELLEIK